MPGAYAAEWASAHADVAAAGAVVSFSATVAGTLSPGTDTTTGDTVVTVPGVALRVRGNPITYEALGLVESEAPTLLFVPDTYGQLPPLGAVGTFGGDTFTVRNVAPTALDGTAIMARIIVAR